MINYPLEAEHILLQQMLNNILKEKWEIYLFSLPEAIDPRKAVTSTQILDMKEDNQFIYLDLRAKVDIPKLKKQMLELNYQFTSTKIELHCSNFRN